MKNTCFVPRIFSLSFSSFKKCSSIVPFSLKSYLAVNSNFSLCYRALTFFVSHFLVLWTSNCGYEFKSKVFHHCFNLFHWLVNRNFFRFWKKKVFCEKPQQRWHLLHRPVNVNWFLEMEKNNQLKVDAIWMWNLKK